MPQTEIDIKKHILFPLTLGLAVAVYFFATDVDWDSENALGLLNFIGFFVLIFGVTMQDVPVVTRFLIGGPPTIYMALHYAARFFGG